MTEAEPIGRDRAMDAGFVSEEAIYALILVAGIIVTAGGHGESSWAAFWIVVGTVVVFFVAHIYAGTLAHLNVGPHERMELGTAFRASVRRSSGLVVGAAIPASILLLGATRVIDDENAMWFALWAEVVALAALGYLAFAKRRASVPVRILGAVTTALFGLAMIGLKVVIH
ncbi:hypothetical protein [Arthrobacter sp. L77]|uniref:hypothetical protein n=1 Tax=Arthrobacter sp. L77 TaxID=1496689 RepID=UPI0005BC9BA8|nr:hypothetical protein [Arthrobacter sp. L77]